MAGPNKSRKSTFQSRNSTNIYDLRGSGAQKPFSVSWFFCMCKSDKVTPVSYLIKFYTLEFINTMLCLLLASTYFVLHKLSILKIYNQTKLHKQIVILTYALSAIFIITKLCLVISNKNSIKNTVYTPTLGIKDTFCKVVSYALLLLLCYFTFATI